VQIIVYGGAIMVLFVFVIMLLTAGIEEHTSLSKLAGPPGLLLVVALAGFVAATIARSTGTVQAAGQTGAMSSTKGISSMLFRDFVYPFELTSFLILVVIQFVTNAIRLCSAPVRLCVAALPGDGATIIRVEVRDANPTPGLGGVFMKAFGICMLVGGAVFFAGLLQMGVLKTDGTRGFSSAAPPKDEKKAPSKPKFPGDLSPAAQAHGVPTAAAFKPGALPHKLVFMTPKGELHPWHDGIPTEWQAETVEETEMNDSGRAVRKLLDRYRLEQRYVKKDGTRFWGDVTLSLVRGPNGEPEFYYAMVEDITERMLAEAARQESEGRFRAVSDLVHLYPAAR